MRRHPSLTPASPPSRSACRKTPAGREGRRIAFTIELTNTCATGIKCRVFAYVTSAKGAKQGGGTITLPPGPKGQETKKSWSMRVKMAGGSAQTARECKAL